MPQEILAEAKAIDTTQTFPQQVPYNIPAGYFNVLPEELLRKAKAGEHRSIELKWWQASKWAAAAIFVLGIALGSYRILNPKPADTNKALAALPLDSIHAYIVQNVDDFETELILNNLSTDKTIKTGHLNEQEIIQYLNEEGWEVKTEVN